jgi:hypothetical protein
VDVLSAVSGAFDGDRVARQLERTARRAHTCHSGASSRLDGLSRGAPAADPPPQMDGRAAVLDRWFAATDAGTSGQARPSVVPSPAGRGTKRSRSHLRTL